MQTKEEVSKAQDQAINTKLTSPGLTMLLEEEDNELESQGRKTNLT